MSFEIPMLIQDSDLDNWDGLKKANAQYFLNQQNTISIASGANFKARVAQDKDFKDRLVDEVLRSRGYRTAEHGEHVSTQNVFAPVDAFTKTFVRATVMPGSEAAETATKAIKQYLDFLDRLEQLKPLSGIREYKIEYMKDLGIRAVGALINYINAIPGAKFDPIYLAEAVAGQAVTGKDFAARVKSVKAPFTLRNVLGAIVLRKIYNSYRVGSKKRTLPKWQDWPGLKRYVVVETNDEEDDGAQEHVTNDE